MKKRSLGALLVAIVTFAFASFTASAAIVSKMTLGNLVGNADKVFRGTVLTKEPSFITAGGGELPTVVYTLRVDESLKGDFGVGKDAKVITLTMLGNLKEKTQENNIKRFSSLNMNPNLSVGSDYILFTTAPSSVGLLTTVGLDQGLFRVFNGANGGEMTANGLSNRGLFNGPVSYSELKNAITAELN